MHLSRRKILSHLTQVVGRRHKQFIVDAVILRNVDMVDQRYRVRVRTSCVLAREQYERVVNRSTSRRGEAYQAWSRGLNARADLRRVLRPV